MLRRRLIWMCSKTDGFHLGGSTTFKAHIFLILIHSSDTRSAGPCGSTFQNFTLKRNVFLGFDLLYLEETVQTFCYIYIACNISGAVQQGLPGPGCLQDAQYIPSSFTRAFQRAVCSAWSEGIAIARDDIS